MDALEFVPSVTVASSHRPEHESPPRLFVAVSAGTSLKRAQTAFFLGPWDSMERKYRRWTQRERAIHVCRHSRVAETRAPCFALPR